MLDEEKLVNLEKKIYSKRWNPEDRIKKHTTVEADLNQSDIKVLLYYIPIALWLEKQVSLGKKNGEKGAVCIALSVPQGGGKTSLTNVMEQVLFDTIGVKTAVISYDDLYLTFEDQKKVTEKYEGNKLLTGRGVAGTHDMEFG